MITYHSLSAAIAQSVERRIGSAEVTGPIPVSSLIKRLEFTDFISVQAFYYFFISFLQSQFILYNYFCVES